MGYNDLEPEPARNQMHNDQTFNNVQSMATNPKPLRNGMLKSMASRSVNEEDVVGGGYSMQLHFNLDEDNNNQTSIPESSFGRYYNKGEDDEFVETKKLSDDSGTDTTSDTDTEMCESEKM